jgi:hypothetical protein
MADRLLVETLGPDGAAAVERAVVTRPALAGAVRPRAALAWAQLAVTHGFQGPSPGSGFDLLVKADGAWSFPDYDGHGAPALAAVLVALAGGDVSKVPRGRVMARLGQNLDLLVKAEFTRGSSPVLDLMRGRSLQKATKPGPQHAGVDKPGPANPPRQASAPQAPQPPTAASQATTVPKPVQPKAPKAPGAVLHRSELEAACPHCGRPQLQDGNLTGCGCFAGALMKAEVVPVTGGFAVRMEDREAFVEFVKAVRRV